MHGNATRCINKEESVDLALHSYTIRHMGAAASSFSSSSSSSGASSTDAAIASEEFIVMPRCDFTPATMEDVVIRDNHANKPLLSTVVAMQKEMCDYRRELGKASRDFPMLLSRISNICIQCIKFSTIMHTSKAGLFFNDIHYLIKSYFDFVHTAVDFRDVLSAQQHRVEWYNALAVLCLCTGVNDSIGPAEMGVEEEQEQATTREIMKDIVNQHQDRCLTHENAFTIFSMLMPSDEPSGSLLQVVPSRLGQCILVLLSLMPCYYVLYTQAELAVATVIIVTKKLIRYDTIARQAWSVNAVKGQQQGEQYANLFSDSYVRAVRSIDANKSTDEECETLWMNAQSAAMEIERLLISMIEANEPHFNVVLRWFDNIALGAADRHFIRGMLKSL